MRRRIALIARRFDPLGGGTERDLIITARALASYDSEVRIYTLEARRSSAEFEVRTVRAPAAGRSLRLLAFAFRAAAAARRDGAELVLSFGRIVGADILRSGGGAHASFLEASRQWRSPAAAASLSPYHRVQMLIERRGFRSPELKKAIAVSNLVRDDLIRSFALEPGKAVTLYNGVDLERFRPAVAGTRQGARRALGVDPDALIVLFVGNGFDRKGLAFLIESMRQTTSAVHLVVAGADRRLNRYRKLTSRCGLERRVSYLGPAADIAQLMAAADVLALPSLFEPFGNVVLEALAAELPVLCSRACGAAEVLPPAMSEFIVRDPTDLGELATRLNSLLAAAGELRGLARETAERFTWRDYAAKLEQLMAELW